MASAPPPGDEATLLEGRKLFIGGISFRTTEDGLRNYFARYGELVDSKIMLARETGESRGFGFVSFALKADADEVIAKKDMFLDGRPLYATLAVRRGEEPPSGESSNHKIFVGGLSKETTDDGLRNFFLRYGDVSDASVMKDRFGANRGFGFVTFKDQQSKEMALNARELLDGQQLDMKDAMSRKFMSDQARSGSVGDTNLSRRVFVKGIGEQSTEADLESYFTQYGNVVDSKVMLEHATKKSRGFGFVTFANEETAVKVCGISHRMNGTSVSCTMALPKAPRESPYGPSPAGYGPAAPQFHHHHSPAARPPVGYPPHQPPPYGHHPHYPPPTAAGYPPPHAAYPPPVAGYPPPHPVAYPPHPHHAAAYAPHPHAAAYPPPVAGYPPPGYPAYPPATAAGYPPVAAYPPAGTQPAATATGYPASVAPAGTEYDYGQAAAARAAGYPSPTAVDAHSAKVAAAAAAASVAAAPETAAQQPGAAYGAHAAAQAAAARDYYAGYGAPAATNGAPAAEGYSTPTAAVAAPRSQRYTATAPAAHETPRYHPYR